METNFKISSISVVKNEGKKIGQCIESMLECIDEIIILVDDSTTDNTLEVIKKYPQVKFELVKWKGYSDTKKIAVEKTTNDWIFWIDADEVITPELRDEINKFKTSSHNCVAYEVKRKAYFLGRWIKHCGWYPGWTMRLFNKQYVKFDDSLVHEGLIINGATGKLNSDLLHFTYDTIEQYFEKLNLYTTLTAISFEKKGKSSSFIGTIIRTFLKFIKMYFFKLGFLDRKEGFLLCVFSSIVIFVERAKLWEIKNRKGNEK